jgi:hypothetical protein
MKPGEEAVLFGILDGFNDIRIEEGFSSMSQIDLEGKRGGFIDDFSIKAKIHITFIFFLEFLIGTHDAFQVTVAGELYPQPYREVGQLAGLLSEMVEKPDQSLPVL